MKFLFSLLVLLSAVFTTEAQTCPVVYFDVPGGYENQCHSFLGTTVSLGVCATDYTLDSVVWLGWPEVTSTVPVMTTSLSFFVGDPDALTTGGIYSLSAVVYMHTASGPCSAVAQDFGSSDPCSGTATDNQLTLRLDRYAISLYTVPSVTAVNTPFEVKLDKTGSIAHDAYSVLIDGTLVAGPTELAEGPGISSATIYSSPGLAAGQHSIALEYYCLRYDCRFYSNTLIEVIEKERCEECFTFQPVPGQKYWLSAWVKEDGTQSLNYTKSEINLRVQGGSSPFATLVPSGDVIEGWQRIAGEFTVPAGISTLDIELKNKYTSGSTAVYFDDIRIHPYNASMKSYVYDPETLWLVAELDDNNFATYYEYDKEGQLIRVKKETERGIVTLKESRSSNSKH